jgi:hypothetical protein
MKSQSKVKHSIVIVDLSSSSPHYAFDCLSLCFESLAESLPETSRNDVQKKRDRKNVPLIEVGATMGFDFEK